MKITIDQNALTIIHDKIENRPIGSGFVFLKRDWIVTAKHVVIKDGLPRDSLFLEYANGDCRKCKVIAVHPELDIALLKNISESVCQSPLMPGNHEFTGKDGLIYVGYKPSLSDETGAKIEINQIINYTLEERHRSAVEVLLHFEAPYAEGGNSGGPILGAGGSVVAIIIEKYTDNNKIFCRATDINVLLNSITICNDWDESVK